MQFLKKLVLAKGGEKPQVGSPFGAGVVIPDLDEMVARGYGRAVTVGAFSTGIVGGGAGTVLDLDQPEFALAVPPGYCARPLRIATQVQVALVAADNDENEILFAVDSQGLWTGDGTFVSEIASNLRTDLGKGSACRIGSAFSADMTTTPSFGAAADPVLDMELARAVETFDIFSTGVSANLKKLDLVYEPRTPPFLIGPCTLLIYFGGTVATVGGFSQVQWLEGPIGDFIQ